LADVFFVDQKIESIFQYRKTAIEERLATPMTVLHT